MRLYLAGILLVVSAILVSNASAQQPLGNCQSYYALQPLGSDVTKLLSTPLAPQRSNEFFTAGARQIEEWDLPSKVTSWQQRPSPQELAQRWQDLNKKYNPSAGAGIAQPYVARLVSEHDWQDLEKWFAKEGPKRVSGLCVDPQKANYTLLVGVVSDQSSGPSANNQNMADYQNTTTATRQDAAVGMNTTTYSPVARENRPDQFSGVGQSDPGGYTCVYVFRIAGGTRQPTPDFYYCRAGGAMPKAAVGTMLKYLAKTKE